VGTKGILAVLLSAAYAKLRALLFVEPGLVRTGRHGRVSLSSSEPFLYKTCRHAVWFESSSPRVARQRPAIQPTLQQPPRSTSRVSPRAR
jgi:hypothetical protein